MISNLPVHKPMPYERCIFAKGTVCEQSAFKCLGCGSIFSRPFDAMWCMVCHGKKKLAKVDASDKRLGGDGLNYRMTKNWKVYLSKEDRQF